jgi:hypothetical protein
METLAAASFPSSEPRGVLDGGTVQPVTKGHHPTGVRIDGILQGQSIAVAR